MDLEMHFDNGNKDVNSNNFQEQTETHQAEYTAHGHKEVYSVSNFHYEQRKAFQRRGSLPVFHANFVTAKWSANSDVNVPDTKTRTLKHVCHCEKSLKSIQQFCTATLESGSF